MSHTPGAFYNKCHRIQSKNNMRAVRMSGARFLPAETNTFWVTMTNDMETAVLLKKEKGKKCHFATVPCCI